MKRVLGALDVEVKRRSRSSEVTLLGLKNFPIQTILDVGANLGQFAHVIAPLFPEARIYSFEPLPEVFAGLKAHASSRIVPIQVALGDIEGVSQMREHVDHPASSSFLSATEKSREYYPRSRREIPIAIRSTTLDKAIDEFDIKLIPDVLIKLDVQGFEDRVLRGAETTLSKSRACILEICLDELYLDQATFPDLIAALTSYGFCYAGNLEQSCANDGHVIFVDALFIRK